MSCLPTEASCNIVFFIKYLVFNESYLSCTFKHGKKLKRWQAFVIGEHIGLHDVRHHVRGVPSVRYITGEGVQLWEVVLGSPLLMMDFR